MTLRAALLGLCVSLSAFAAEPDDATLPQLKGEAKARIQNLDQCLNDWDIEGAEVELHALEALAPADVEPLAYYQARVAFERGRYDDAVTLLEKAQVADKPGSWLRLAKDSRDVVAGDERLESEHFIILTPKGKDVVLGPWALEALEKQRAALEKDLGYAPPGKVRVEIVNDARELSRISTLTREAIKTTGTIAICKFDKLMVTSPKAVMTGYDWLDTVAHEYTHLVVSRKSHNTVPIWLHEGLAKYLESRWRGPYGGAMTPSTLALLGARVRTNKLVPFEKMHPSMALLPTAEDAACAFAEVFFAVELLHRQGEGALSEILSAMAKGQSDRAAVEAVFHHTWADFEHAWMAHLKSQPFPKELVPPSLHEKKVLAENAKAEQKKPKREISFGDFAEVQETEARKAAHLGELLRERGRLKAAAENYERAWKQVGDRYESVSNKYALTLLELKRYPEAEKVLEGSLTLHPGAAATNVHLARLYLRERDWVKVKRAAFDALAVNPFDPEVHLALLRSAQALHDEPLVARTTAAAAVLLKLPGEKIPLLAQRLGQEEDLAQGPSLDAQAGSPADAGH